MKGISLQRTKVLIIALCLFLTSCQNSKPDDWTIDYTIETSGNVDFGKTEMSAYTPEIREYMKQLYEDKFGLIFNYDPYAQLEGV